MEAEIIRSVAAKHGLQLQSHAAVPGGDINRAFKLSTSDGQVFLKANMLPDGERMLQTESYNLRTLKQHIAVPDILGEGEQGGWAYLLLTYHEPAEPKAVFWERFGSAMAKLHLQSADHYGWPESNFIGSLRQSNASHDHWIDFFRDQRIIPQLDLAAAKNLIAIRERKLFDQLFNHLPEILVADSQSLLHGDLWSGNFLVTEDQHPMLIDPSCYYGHREMDLAMTQLFGGFHPTFYAAYEAQLPTESGLSERIPIYQLYYLLVHLNIFGRSYWSRIESILQAY